MCLKVRTSDVNFRVALCKLGSAVMRLVLWRDYMVTGEERIIGRVSVCVCVCVCVTVWLVVGISVGRPLYLLGERC